MITLQHDLPTVTINSKTSSENWLISIQYRSVEDIQKIIKKTITKGAKTLPHKQAKRSAAIIGIICEMKDSTFKKILLDCAVSVINNLEK